MFVNRLNLKSKMALKEHTYVYVSKLLGIQPRTLIYKMEGLKKGFTEKEIELLVDEYGFSILNIKKK